jgi:hypothetical protein
MCGCVDVDNILLAPDRVQYMAFVNTVMNLRSILSKGNYLTAERMNISYKEFYLFGQLNLVIVTQIYRGADKSLARPTSRSIFFFW